MQKFVSGVMANWLVCLSTWMAAATTSMAGKAIAVLAPTSMFVAIGLEHSVANVRSRGLTQPIAVLASMRAFCAVPSDRRVWRCSCSDSSCQQLQANGNSCLLRDICASPRFATTAQRPEECTLAQLHSTSLLLCRCFSFQLASSRAAASAGAQCF